MDHATCLGLMYLFLIWIFVVGVLVGPDK